MALVYEIKHNTTYRYAAPVTIGEHRAMFLPRVGYGGRVISHHIQTNVPSRIRWIMDTLSNNVAIMEFDAPATELSVECSFRAVHFGLKGVEAFPLERRAKEIPVQFTPDEWIDLAAFMRPHAEDPDGSLAAWAMSFVTGDRTGTADVLKRMMDEIRDTFTYQPRDAEGTQPPGQTLSSRTGTCRDYAWLMIEALRRLGLPCRFISGYLYDASLDGGLVGMAGSGATHAWLQVYLPGAGWLFYDPTNRITEGFDLVPVATARHPGQAVPLAGSWFGEPQHYLGMDVTVSVHKIAELADV
jgi:transglutaminase-like putative cysteine protease